MPYKSYDNKSMDVSKSCTLALQRSWIHVNIHEHKVDSSSDGTPHILCRAKGFQHQRMTNGAMNVEIGNPAYKIYEGEPDDDAGELLDADFTLDPDKVKQ